MVATVYMEVTLPTTGDVEATPLVDTEVIALSSTEPFVHTDEGFLGGPNDRSMLIGYVDHVTFRL